MKLTTSMGRQAGDFLTYILLPLCCVLLPYKAGQAAILKIAGKGWLLQARSSASLALAQRFVSVADAHNWKVRWRLTELMEARDLWFSMLGRRKALLRGVRQTGVPQVADRLVLIGMHWGPSVLALQLFRAAGLAPRFVHRTVRPEVMRASPFYYFYLRLLVAYIHRICEGREITVPGARRELEAAQSEAGSPVILLDAPITQSAQPISITVGRLRAELNADGPKLLVNGKALCVLYSMGLDESGTNVLNCAEPFVPGSVDQLLQRFADLMSQHLTQDSAQWRLWHAADQLFRQPAVTAEPNCVNLSQVG